MEREKNWADFYNSLTNIRDKREEKEGFIIIDVNDRDEFFNKLLEKVLNQIYLLVNIPLKIAEELLI